MRDVTVEPPVVHPTTRKDARLVAEFDGEGDVRCDRPNDDRRILALGDEDGSEMKVLPTRSGAWQDYDLGFSTVAAMAKGNVSWSDRESNRVLPEEFLDRLTTMFAESIGPMAKLVVHEKIAALGETHDAFPESRFDDLMKALDQEIILPEMKLQFQQKIGQLRTEKNF